MLGSPSETRDPWGANELMRRRVDLKARYKPPGRQTDLASHGLGSLTGGATSFDFQQYPAAQSLVRDVEAPRLIANVATGRGGGITGWYVRR